MRRSFPRGAEIIVLDRASQRLATFVERGWNVGRRINDAMFYRIAFSIAAARRGGAGSAVVVPQPILPMYTIWKTCMLLGLRIVPESRTPGDVAVYWEDTTISGPPDAMRGWINARCTNIGKDMVERRFAEVFGYPLGIDVTTHAGPYVRKSRLNFAHNGMIRNGPGKCETDCVYERLIDNSIDDGWQVVDMRTAIVGTQIPVVFLLYRSIVDRFGTDSRRGVVVSPDTVFSPFEQEQIVAMAQAMGLDYGELDVLRDKSNGRIYIVDVNKTPVGPPRPLVVGERHRAMRLIANAFGAEFLERRGVGLAAANFKV